MKTGERDRLITVQRSTVVLDEYGGETSSWATLEQGWAKVRFGLAGEKRQAAQEGASQAASFELVTTSALLGVQMTDRIHFDDSDWDITEVAPLDRQTIRLTAVRAV